METLVILCGATNKLALVKGQVYRLGYDAFFIGKAQT